MIDKIDNPIKWLQELSIERIIIPDRAFIFLIDPSEAIKRIQHRDNLIPFEKVSFLDKVNENYKKLTKGKRFKKIDVKKSIDELVKFCIADIKS